MMRLFMGLFIAALLLYLLFSSIADLFHKAESAPVEYEWSGCTTDTDCMDKFGGDGGPGRLQ